MFFWNELGRSLKRHGKKSAIALAVSAALAFFLFLFAGSITANQRQLDDLEQNSDLRLTFVNVSGTRDSSLIIYDDKLEVIEESGLAETGFYAVMALFSDGTEDDNRQFSARNSYWKNQPIVAYTDDSPLTEAGEDNVTYFDGYDASMFQGSDPVCLMAKEKFDRMGLSPGEEITVRLFTFKDTQGSMGVFKGEETSLKVVGTYVEPGTIYTGPAINLICPYRTLRTQFRAMNLSIWPSRAYLRITDPANLNPLKDLLKEIGISHVEKTLDSGAAYGKTAVINDSVYIGTAEPTMRTLSLLRSLYPAVFAAVSLISLLTSYLLIQSRREEIAIQRSLGTGRLRIFFTFFVESACLCLMGIVLAFAAAVLLLSQPPLSLLLPALGCFGFCLLGSAIAVLLLERTDVLAVLSAAE